MNAKVSFQQQVEQHERIEQADGTLPRVSSAPIEQVQPLADRPIQWAPTAADLEQEAELLKNRHWLSEALIAHSQKHWHCSRLQAVKYLLRGLDECSA